MNQKLQTLAGLLGVLLCCGVALADDLAPVTIETRETALAGTLDMEFQDAMKDGGSGAVTLEQLLVHTSGMPDECGEDFDRVSKTDFLTKCAATPLAFPAGSKFQYSNAEYSLLAMIVEQVSGESIEGYLKNHFFERLGMKDTGFTFASVPRERFALGYLDGKRQEAIDKTIAPLGDDTWNRKGNGGMQATT